MPEPQDRHRPPEFLRRCLDKIDKELASLRDKREIILHELADRERMEREGYAMKESLRALRDKAISNGMTLLSENEVLDLVAKRRAGKEDTK